MARRTRHMLRNICVSRERSGEETGMGLFLYHLLLSASYQGGKARLIVERLQIFIAFNSHRDICIQPVVNGVVQERECFVVMPLNGLETGDVVNSTSRCWVV